MLLQSSLKSCWDGNRLNHLFVRLPAIFPFWVLEFLHIPFYLEDSVKTESPEAHLEARIYLYISDLLQKCSQENSVRKWEKQEGAGRKQSMLHLQTRIYSGWPHRGIRCGSGCCTLSSPEAGHRLGLLYPPTLPVLRKDCLLHLEWKKQTPSSVREGEAQVV